MSQVYCYMFEAKSIQKYIFRTGKLRDVIATSERLEQLIDTDKDNILSKVLDEIGVNIKFVRRKGGAFYAYGEYNDLLKLRKIWTLTVQQLFPSLDFIDGIGEGGNIVVAMEDAQQELSESRNNPNVKVPLMKANMQFSARTAKPALGKDHLFNEYIDADTKINRYVYQQMKNNAEGFPQLLYKKFTDQQDSPFPLNLEPKQQSESNSFPYQGDDHDLALIHIDGNGIGLLLRGLKEALSDLSDEKYSEIFLKFSNILARATQSAAKIATENLIETVKKQGESIKILPMRPLVMGGDDITLFCRADLAIDYAKDFCLAFQDATGAELESLYDKHDGLKGLPNRLTASGGIIFQKATQPFTVSHHIVEDLCNQAKINTKMHLDKEGIGPPALAFMQIATAQEDSYQRLFVENYQVQTNKGIIKTAIGNYLVSDLNTPEDARPQLNDLLELVDLINTKQTPVSHNKLRQILAEIHNNNLPEAENLIRRLEQRKGTSLNKIKAYFNKIKGSSDGDWWMWKDAKNKQTILSDILTLIKFKGEAS